MFVCWPGWVRVSLASFWGSPLFFGRVHFIPLTIHTFLFILVFIFLTLVSSTEEGHIFRPPFRHGSFFLGCFYRLHFLLPGVATVSSHMLFPVWLPWHQVVELRSKQKVDTCQRDSGKKTDFRYEEQMRERISCRVGMFLVVVSGDMVRGANLVKRGESIRYQRGETF